MHCWVLGSVLATVFFRGRGSQSLSWLLLHFTMVSCFCLLSDGLPTDGQFGPLIFENKLKIGTDTNIVADHIRYDVSTT
jgi:hypothetical protein